MSLNISKGPGPDLIPPSLLRYCSTVLTYPLTVLFNKSLSSGTFPDVLKQSHIIPIYKSGDKANIKNYRPITIQSSIAKLFESLILDKIAPLFQNIIVEQQHGFTKGKSTSTNLFLYHNYILDSFAENCQVDAVYTDFSKAFDKVNHNCLLTKLSLYGFHGPLLNWFASYLHNRTLSVKLKSFQSFPFTAQSGVPQGSHLGPFLFLLFINDISFSLQNVHFLMFADDLNLLQEKLNAINTWCNENCMTLNINKCNVITFSKIKSSIVFQYSLNNQLINRCDIVKDLGIYIDQELTFRNHIEQIVNNSLRLLFFILRHSKDFNEYTTVILFTSLVRPLLEYCTVIWSPYYSTHIKQIENVQNKFLRILGSRLGYSYRDVPINELLYTFKLTSLELRRKKFDSIFLYKIINNIFNCTDSISLINFHVPSIITRSVPLFVTPSSSSNYMYNAPINRLHRTGNSLNKHVDFFNDNLNKFKANISSLFSHS
ncbi:hypothetical protein O3M35_003686 [Rhynocoris fuscipes]|uniref:Reverse transcriptase domain-containing protein n=1 Tax=Rhynocoris fuscipes TaxID=488301 RepID=A0AAW1CJQ6_9HEMI